MSQFEMQEEEVTRVTLINAEGEKVVFYSREEAIAFVEEQKQAAAAAEVKAEVDAVVENYLNAMGLADRKRAGRANVASDFMTWLKLWDGKDVERTVMDKVKEEPVVVVGETAETTEVAETAEVTETVEAVAEAEQSNEGEDDIPF